MDAEERKLFASSVDEALTRRGADRLVPALLDEGWAELCADNEAAAMGVFFERAGAHLTGAPVLDLAVSSIAPGARPVLGLGGREDPATTDGSVLHIDGVTFDGGTEPGPLLIGYAERGNPDGVVAIVPADRVKSEDLAGLDPDLGLRRVRGEIARSGTEAVDSVSGVELTAQLRRCLAHLLVGVAERSAELAGRHVRDRTQFGRPLGTWQTVAHRLADAHIDIAAARAALDAAWRDRLPLAAAAAKSQAAAAATGATDSAQQLFGAIGFTWEHEIHRFVRRCVVLDAVLGSRTELNAELGTHLLAARTLEPVSVAL